MGPVGLLAAAGAVRRGAGGRGHTPPGTLIDRGSTEEHGVHGSALLPMDGNRATRHGSSPPPCCGCGTSAPWKSRRSKVAFSSSTSIRVVWGKGTGPDDPGRRCRSYIWKI